jgi:hypothetical protein
MRCQLVGLDFGRETIAIIEAQKRVVSDRELVALSKVLKVSLSDLVS